MAQRNHGFGTVELLVSIVIVIQAMLALSVVTQLIARSTSGATVKTNSLEVKSRITSFLLHPDNWAATLEDPVNKTYLSCRMANQGGCAQTASLRLVRPDGGVYFSHADGMGLTKNGAICTGYNAADRNPACPASYAITWTVTCPGLTDPCTRPSIQISGTFNYQNESENEATVFQSESMGFTLRQAVPDVSDLIIMPQILNVNMGDANVDVPVTLTDPRLLQRISGFELEATPQKGSASVVGGSTLIRYTPQSIFYGSDTFKTRASYSQFGRTKRASGIVLARVMTPYTWVGDGGDSDFYNPRNWCGEVVNNACTYNVAIDRVGGDMRGASPVFNELCGSGSTCVVNIDAEALPLRLNSLEMTNGFIGTVNLRRSLAIETARAGTLQAATCSISYDPEDPDGTVANPLLALPRDVGAISWNNPRPDALITHGRLAVGGGRLVVDNSAGLGVLELGFGNQNMNCVRALNVWGQGDLEFQGPAGSIRVNARNSWLSLNPDNILGAELADFAVGVDWSAFGGLTVMHETGSIAMNRLNFSSQHPYRISGKVVVGDLHYQPGMVTGSIIQETVAGLAPAQDVLRSAIDVTGNLNVSGSGGFGAHSSYPDHRLGTIRLIGTGNQVITGEAPSYIAPPGTSSNADLLASSVPIGWGGVHARLGIFGALPNLLVDKPSGGTVTFQDLVPVASSLRITEGSSVDMSQADLALTAGQVFIENHANNPPLLVRNLYMVAEWGGIRLSGQMRVTENIYLENWHSSNYWAENANSFILLEGDLISRRYVSSNFGAFPLLIKLVGSANQKIRSDMGGEGTASFCNGSTFYTVAGVTSKFCNLVTAGIPRIQIEKTGGQVAVEGSVTLLHDFEVISPTLVDLSLASLRFYSMNGYDTQRFLLNTAVPVTVEDLIIQKSVDFNGLDINVNRVLALQDVHNVNYNRQIRNATLRVQSDPSRPTAFQIGRAHA